MLRQADAANSAIVEVGSRPVKVGVVIAYLASAALSGALPGIVYLYRQQRPHVELVLHQMDMEEQIDAVTKGLCDVGFIRPPIALPEGVALFDVLREPLMVALRSNHRCAAMARVRLEDLQDDTLISVHRKEGIGFWKHNDEGLRCCGLCSAGRSHFVADVDRDQHGGGRFLALQSCRIDAYFHAARRGVSVH